MRQPEMTPAAIAEHLLTQEQAAEVLGVTPRYVRDMRARNVLPYVKVGKLVRFRRSDLVAFIEANLVDKREGA